MTEWNFLDNTKKLKRIFGEQNFPPERVEMIQNAFRKLTDQEFTELCSIVIGDCRTAPLLKDFYKLGQSILDIANAREKKAQDNEFKTRREEGRTCRMCDDIGSVSACDTTNRHASSYSFRCPMPDCVASRRLSKQIQLWGPEWEPRFKLVGKDECFHQIWLKQHESDKISPLTGKRNGFEEIPNKIKSGELEPEGPGAA